MTDTSTYPPEDVAKWTAAIQWIMARDGVTEKEANAGLQWAIRDAIDKAAGPPADPSAAATAIAKIESGLADLKAALT